MTRPCSCSAADDPVAKWTVAQAANRATAATASRFLDKPIDQMPLTVKAVQVDGGSEFKVEFEDACRAKGLALYELPPKPTQLYVPTRAAMAHGDTNSTAPTICPVPSTPSIPSSTASGTSTTTTEIASSMP